MTFTFDENIIVSCDDVRKYLVSLGDSVNRNFVFDDFRQFWPRVSELGHPAILLAMHKPEIKEAMCKAGFSYLYIEQQRSDVLERLCMVGDWFEAYCILALQRAGWTILYPNVSGQKEVSYGIARGHVDIIACDEEGEPSQWVFECKTMNSNYFRQFTKRPNDDKGYLTQLAVYDAALNYEYNPAFLCLNRDTGEVEMVEPYGYELSECLERVDEILEVLDTNFTVPEIDDIFEAPEPVPEIYKRKPTGRYVLPYMMKFDPLRFALYEIEPDLNGYGKLTEYVTGYKSVSEIYNERISNGT